jgi:hypothetical protein
LRYVSTVVGYGPAEEPPPAKPGEMQVVHVDASTAVRHEELIQEVPSVALRVDGGWLAGADRGEWGGELVFVGDDGVKQTIRDGNVQGLDRIGNRIVAAGGIAHLTLNDGDLFDVRRGPDGRWQATPWRGLPGAPWHTASTSAGELLVRTADGDVLVSADGAMRMAPCKD